jgi:DNA-binding response OmpR family regulator
MPAQDDTRLSESPKGAGCRVLIVDDYEPSAMTMTWAVELDGYETRTCFDGPSALQMADEFRPHIILLDIGMPMMNGFEVCRLIREKHADHDIYILAHSAWGDSQTLLLAWEAGFSDHMTKPVNIDAMLRKLQDFISKR